MCPTGRALAHLATGLLTEWATLGCAPPTRDNHGPIIEIWEAIAHGLHQSALSPAVIGHFSEEASKKVRTKQARIVMWETWCDPNWISFLWYCNISKN